MAQQVLVLYRQSNQVLSKAWDVDTGFAAGFISGFDAPGSPLLLLGRVPSAAGREGASV